MKNFFKKTLYIILAIESYLILKKYKPYIIAVTGSVGKTSTKDAIYTVLSPNFFVRKSQKSFNSETGIPLTILGRPNAWSDIYEWIKNILTGLDLIIKKQSYPTHLVLEVGADRPGDIRFVSRWLSPDVVVVTHIPKIPVHIEFFKSREDLVEEKSYLIKSLKKGGVLILNADDPNDYSFFKNMRPDAKVMTYGFSEGANIRGENVSIDYVLKNKVKEILGTKFNIVFSLSDTGGVGAESGFSGSLGIQHVYPVLSASAVAIELGLDYTTIAVTLKSYKAPIGRMNIIHGLNESTIIDDSYNSSPKALDEALNVLKSINLRRRKIAVFGDMLELGKYSADEHFNLGKKIADVADILVVVGVRACGFGLGAESAGLKKDKIFVFNNSEEAGIFLEKFIEKRDIVLVKGSQGARMEKAIYHILPDKLKASELLVRQDEEWKVR